MKKKSIKKGIKAKVEGDGEKEGVRIEEIFLVFFLLFLLFVSFSDLRKSDCRFSSRLKAKLIYAMRATRGHQKVGVLTNSMRYEFYPT